MSSLTKRLVFSAMAIALATVTSFIKIFDMPMGGSITLLSMFFICLIGYWYGLGAGITAGVAYGLLQFMIEPYFLSIPQVAIDYLFAFGALGLSGLFSNKRHGLLLGYIVGVFGRFIFAFISGMVFFGSYASSYNMSIPIYSICYNGAYIGAEAVITIVLLLLPPISRALMLTKKLAVESSNNKKSY